MRLRDALLILASLGLLLAVSVAAGEAERGPGEQKAAEAVPVKGIDLGGMIKEMMQFRMEGNRNEVALWLPHEFLVQSGIAEGNSRAVAEKELALFKPYLAIVVQVSRDLGNGKSIYVGEPGVRSRAALRLKDGSELKPLEKVPPQVEVGLVAMKKLMTAEGDEGSRHTYVLLFPATDKDGRDLVDIRVRDKLTFVLKGQGTFPETVFTWHTPFDALIQTPPCRKCKEPVSAKWSFCPWCGEKIEPATPAPAPADSAEPAPKPTKPANPPESGRDQ